MSDSVIYPAPPDKARMRIVAIVRDHMSGLLYAVPYLRALRQRWPEAHITLLGNPYATPIMENCPYVDDIVPFFVFRQEAGRFPRLTGLWYKLQSWLKLVGRVDLVVHFRYTGPSSILWAASWGKPFQVGYSQYRFDSLLDAHLGPEDVELGSRQRNALILEAIGFEEMSPQMELWLQPEDKAWSQQFLIENGWEPDKPLFVLHPGCHWGCNQWITGRWAQLGDALIDRYGGTVVITGSDDEEALAAEVVAAMRHTPINAAGRTTLDQFAAIIDKATLVTAVDTAPTQFCQALNKKSVIMMGAGTVSWNGPLPGEPMIMLQRFVERPGPPLCDYAAGACNGPQCQSDLERITLELVMRSIDKLLAAEVTPVNG
ncbi:MAG: glycosyltransferase family 9 protein [Anaerolineales bacterium]|nr:glycosyltransferase family 9 protein [Anaerolineales bacterium]MCB8961344.1 glycosyltransferase family 9 protein [Ardenticatenales bacterium]